RPWPVQSLDRYRRCYSTAKVLKSNGRFRNEVVTAGDSQERGSVASAGRLFGAFELQFAGVGSDGPHGIAAGGSSAGPVRARQWRPCSALDHHLVADGIERRAARENAGDQ